jgi:hypothetical protein
MQDQSPNCNQPTLRDTPVATSSQASVAGTMPCVSPAGPKIAPCGPEAAPVSRSRSQASTRAQRTSGTCGPSGSGSSASFALTASMANKLRERLGTGGSTLYLQTWREKATPAGRRYWAHIASVPRKSDRGSIGWQTPTTRDGKGQSGRGNRVRRGSNGRLHVANLCDQLVDLGRPDLVRSGEFRCWLMGYPEQWDDAGVTAMQSCRKSRRNSSKRAKRHCERAPVG